MFLRIYRDRQTVAGLQIKNKSDVQYILDDGWYDQADYAELFRTPTSVRAAAVYRKAVGRRTWVRAEELPMDHG